MKVRAIKCDKCGDTIYSRALHDFRSCTCGRIFIDGGFDYTRIGWEGEMEEPPRVFELTLNNITRIDLYEDWSSGKNCFGLLKGDANAQD